MSTIRIALSRLRRLPSELIPEKSLKSIRMQSTVAEQTVDTSNNRGEKEKIEERTLSEDAVKTTVKPTSLSRQQLTNYILNHVLYEDDHLLAFNKPNGLPIFVDKSQVPGPALIYLDKDGVAKNCKSVPNSDSLEISIGSSRHGNKHSQIPPPYETSLSLFDILEDLQHHVNSSVLEIGMPLSRLYSGVVVLTKTPEAKKKLRKYLEMTRSQKLHFQTFKCVTVGIPSPPQPGPEEMMCRLAQIDNQTLTETATNVSVNLSKKGEVMRFMVDSEIVQTNTHLNCSVLDVKPTKDKWDVVEWYCTRRLCCALGDHVYSSRVGSVLGVPTHIEPHVALPKTQDLPKNVRERLRLKESQVSCLPLHIHRHSVELRGIPFKHSKSITISAPLPDFFLSNMRLLRLSNFKVDCRTPPCEPQTKAVDDEKKTGETEE